MYDGDIIDTHMHLWDLKNNYEWLNKNIPEFEQLIGNYDSLRHNFLAKDYQNLIQTHKVMQSIHVQAFGFPANPIGETKWLHSQAELQGFPHAIVAFANLADPDVKHTLEQHAKFPRVRGIRMPLNYHKKKYLRMAEKSNFMLDPQWQEGFALLAHYNFSFDMQIYDHQIEDAVALAEKFPHITIIIEHFAWPVDLSATGFELWKKHIEHLVNFPNIHMKLSGIGCVFQKMSIKQINKYIETTVRTLGVERCMFGSNCPPDTLFYDFSRLLAIYKKAFSVFPEEDQHKLFYLNAKRTYHL